MKLALGTGTLRTFATPAGINGATQSVTPTVYQQYDRWGNVLQV